jgi:hypothetical protein
MKGQDKVSEPAVFNNVRIQAGLGGCADAKEVCVHARQIPEWVEGDQAYDPQTQDVYICSFISQKVQFGARDDTDNVK